MSVEGVAAETEDNAGYRSQPRPEMLDFVPRDRRGMKVLEVGCGDGAFAASIPNVTEVWGVEPYEPAAKLAETRLHKVFATTFEQAKPHLGTGCFDLVVCNDVIEHMTDHDAFLASVQDVMADGSVIIGSLPNVRYYKNLFNLVVAGDWEYENFGILDRTHFRFFTQKAIRRSLARAGFEVQRLEGINGGLGAGWSPWTLAYNAFAVGMIVSSGGRARDIRHLQIGFRAVRPARATVAA